MDAFAANPPEWTDRSVHSYNFFCPKCGSGSREAVGVWLNRRSPVTTPDHRRKWQEFYLCHCGCAWWAWSTDRPSPKKSDEV
jgi:hypothetical protein